MSTDSNKSLPIPGEDSTEQPTADPALNLIREKVSHLYEQEPSAEAEEQEIEEVGAKSKHQVFIQNLTNSGKSLAEIQTTWHNYYQNLPDAQKHEVWQEFYANHPKSVNYFKKATPNENLAKSEDSNNAVLPKKWLTEDELAKSTEDSEDVKKRILENATKNPKSNFKKNFQSLVFGLGMGVIVIGLLSFSFFNERFIAPFITPSKVASISPMILDPNQDSTVDPNPTLIIPKINVQVPVVYDVNSIEEDDIQAGLEKGAVHYPGTAVPGQNGNTVLVGHSSANIFNSGKYKFAFVLLNKLEVGDTFLINYNGKRFVYKIYNKKIVKPTETSVLGAADKIATATLITCDPPGTNVNRLVLLAEQISPEPDASIASVSNINNTDQIAVVPGNSQSLFSRLFGWITD
jgi:sortase A